MKRIFRKVLLIILLKEYLKAADSCNLFVAKRNNAKKSNKKKSFYKHWFDDECKAAKNNHRRYRTRDSHSVMVNNSKCYKNTE